jgi:hypothetical protein
MLEHLVGLSGSPVGGIRKTLYLSNFPFIDYCRLTVAKVSSFLSGMMEYETPKVVKVRDVNCDVHRVPTVTTKI